LERAPNLTPSADRPAEPHPVTHDEGAGNKQACPAPDAVIVIFGAAVRPGGRPSTTLHRRVEAAAAFGVRFAAPLYVPTGGVGRFGPSEASVMATLLETRGVSPGCILLEETGTDTLSSARAVARLLHARGVSAPVFAASSLYHVPRCVVLLRMFGVAARAAGPPWVSAGLHWTTRCYWWLREAAALPYDAALALFLRLRGRG
jgi:uncharacterized SAM-binding protein YcdF (DUF218 family)